MNDRYGVTVKGGDHVPHHTAQRDYVCGACGGKLSTRWFDDAPHWRTVCTGNAGHSADGFVKSASYEYRKVERILDQEQARDVFAGLPAELQAAILEG